MKSSNCRFFSFIASTTAIAKNGSATLINCDVTFCFSYKIYLHIEFIWLTLKPLSDTG